MRVELKNTAVPGTLGSIDRSMSCSARLRCGRDSFFARMISVPRRQVVSITNITSATDSGNHAPWPTFHRFAPTNANSSNAITTTTGKSSQ